MKKWQYSVIFWSFFVLAIIGFASVLLFIFQPVAAAAEKAPVVVHGYAEKKFEPTYEERLIAEANRIEEKTIYVYLGKYKITGYDACKKCCRKTDGITASGVKAEVGKTVASGKEFAFGTEIYIDGIGVRTVEDRGVKNGALDVFCEDHSSCYAITGYYDVYKVVRIGD